MVDFGGIGKNGTVHTLPGGTCILSYATAFSEYYQMKESAARNWVAGWYNKTEGHEPTPAPGGDDTSHSPGPEISPEPEPSPSPEPEPEPTDLVLPGAPRCMHPFTAPVFIAARWPAGQHCALLALNREEHWRQGFRYERCTSCQPATSTGARCQQRSALWEPAGLPVLP